MKKTAKKTTKKYQSAGTVVSGRSATRADAMKEFNKGSNKSPYSSAAQADSAITAQKAKIDSMMTSRKTPVKKAGGKVKSKKK